MKTIENKQNREATRLAYTLTTNERKKQNWKTQVVLELKTVSFYHCLYRYHGNELFERLRSIRYVYVSIK